jgi:protease IV
MDDSFSSPGAPPPIPPPPPVIMALPAKPAKSRGWMIIAIIFIVLFCFCVFIIFAQFVSHAMRMPGNFGTVSETEAGPQLQEAVLKDNHSDNKIAVVKVEGVISEGQTDDSGNNAIEVIKTELEAAKKDSSVRAVILKVDSPGGEVLAADEIYRAIKKFEAGPNGKPVICSMGALAASGGYYISAPCRWIVCNQLTLTGSIGVIMETVNFRGLMDKIGVQPYVFKSGEYKDMLSPMRETNDIPAGEHALVQDLVNQTYAKFKGVVADGRNAAHEKNKDEGQPLADDWASYADGRVLSGDQALKLGLVDELGDFQDAVDRANKIAGTQKANLIEYHDTYDISQFLRLFGQSGQASRANVKVDLGFDALKSETDLRAGELYFLYLPMSD